MASKVKQSWTDRYVKEGYGTKKDPQIVLYTVSDDEFMEWADAQGLLYIILDHHIEGKNAVYLPEHKQFVFAKLRWAA